MHKLSVAGTDNSHCTAENPGNALGVKMLTVCVSFLCGKFWVLNFKILFVYSQAPLDVQCHLLPPQL